MKLAATAARRSRCRKLMHERADRCRQPRIVHVVIPPGWHQRNHPLRTGIAFDGDGVAGHRLGNRALFDRDLRQFETDPGHTALIGYRTHKTLRMVGTRKLPRQTMFGHLLVNTRSGTRTRTPFRARDFKSRASTDFAIRVCHEAPHEATIVRAGIKRKTGAPKRSRNATLTMKSGKRDSNPRPQPWQGCALPTELFPHTCCPPRF